MSFYVLDCNHFIYQIYSQLRSRARADAEARRAAGPPPKAEGNPTNLFYANSNGAARYEQDYTDPAATSDKAKIVEQAEGYAAHFEYKISHFLKTHIFVRILRCEESSSN